MPALSSPVLFTVFNRPQATRESFARIRDAKPSRLYVAADGPRPWVARDVEDCYEVRTIATSVDWECNLQTLFRKSNLGCGSAMSSAISWFFNQEDQGIILEDDCISEPSFFTFCEELLHRYADDSDVMFVSGTTLDPGVGTGSNSYRFTRVPLMWGWATWARAWDLNRPTSSAWPELPTQDWLESIGIHRKATRQILIRLLEASLLGELDTWDFQWIFSVWMTGGIGIIPGAPLVANIGIGDEATHTTSTADPRKRIETRDLQWPIAHPTDRQIDSALDEELLRVWFQPTFKKLLDLELQRLDRRLLGGAVKRFSQSIKHMGSRTW